MSIIVNILNQTFGSLTVVGLSNDRNPEGRKMWMCRCICGSKKLYIGKYLRNGKTTGCGCVQSRKKRSLAEDRNPNWKGGYKNRGSKAWATQKIAKTNSNSVKRGYSKLKCTNEELLILLNNSNNKCYICNKQENLSKNHEILNIDHCHKTGIVRGLLCNNCNVGIGLFKDNIEILEKAILYLKQFDGVSAPVLA